MFGYCFVVTDQTAVLPWEVVRPSVCTLWRYIMVIYVVLIVSVSFNTISQIVRLVFSLLAAPNIINLVQGKHPQILGGTKWGMKVAVEHKSCNTVSLKQGVIEQKLLWTAYMYEVSIDDWR